MRRASLALFLFSASIARAESVDPGRAVEAQLSTLSTESIYVLVDKPLYRPGETIWFRAWEVTLRSMTSAPDHGVNFQLLDPRGAPVVEKRVLAQSGLAANDLKLDAALPGGEYTLVATSERGAKTSRHILVAAYEVPRVKKRARLLRASYAPGDAVTAVVDLEKATGEPHANARVDGIVWVDGVESGRVTTRSDARGAALLRFRLPASVGRGEGLLTVLVDAGGATESMSLPIPIVTGEVQVTFYPEGGDLVAGLPSRVYLEARTPLGEPADVSGKIVDQRGKLIAKVRTGLRGMGRFAISPDAHSAYQLVVGKQTFQLPATQTAGCVLSTEDGDAGAAVAIEVRCTDKLAVTATAVLRETLVAEAKLDVHRGKPARARLAIPAQGIVRVTLFTADGRPLAERLVYRNRGKGLRVSITGDRKSYGPRDQVTLTIQTRGADGQPVSADVAVAVIDDAVRALAANAAKGAGNILSALYLEAEMPGQRIDDPSFYFSNDKSAPAALDLLLGTAGWRRFAWRWVSG